MGVPHEPDELPQVGASAQVDGPVEPRVVVSRLRQAMRGARTTLANARAFQFLRPGRARAVALPPSAPRFEAHTGIALSRVYNGKIAGRMLTIERALARFGDHIRG